MIQAGTIIHGTHRNEDLIPAFTSELGRIDPERLERITEFYPKAMVDHSDESASDLVYELIDALDEKSPRGMYFGTLEGDGSDYGWWSFDEDLV